MNAEKALVFDTRRFAVHDGSGIRTTVFFKGCGMRCRWCQNPEGLSSDRRILWLGNSCIHCGSCAKAAVAQQMDFRDGSPILNLSFCGSFDNLIQACPAGAIRYDSQWYTVEELIQEIRRDEVFFRYGGGVTFSGGEPLLQKDFLIECLNQCRSLGISTAAESALYVPPAALQAAVSGLSELFADFKCYSDSLHRSFTGVSNQLIRENLIWILEHAEIPVTVRTPLIPGYTATEENIAAIAGFLAGHNPHVTYELLNYNELAPAKYSLMGTVYEPGERKRFSSADMERFRRIAAEKGLYNVI